MHPYSTDIDNGYIEKAVAIIALLLYLIFTYLYDSYLGPATIDQYGYLIFIPPIVIFGIIYGLTHSYTESNLWKNSLFQKKCKIPDLNGEWKGTGISSQNNKIQFKVDMIIEQSWKKISIDLEFESSSSNSISASLICENGNSAKSELIYQYLNHPKQLQENNLNMHHGTAWLVYDESGDSLKGSYYNKERNTTGELNLKRVNI